MKLLGGGLKARSAYVDVPDVLIMAAKVRHEGMLFMWRVSGARCWSSRGIASLIESDP